MMTMLVNDWPTHLLDLPLPVGGGHAVAAVLRRLHAAAADAGVVGATEHLQAPQVDGTQGQVGGGATGAAGATQSVSAHHIKHALQQVERGSQQEGCSPVEHLVTFERPRDTEETDELVCRAKERMNVKLAVMSQGASSAWAELLVNLEDQANQTHPYRTCGEVSKAAAAAASAHRPAAAAESGSSSRPTRSRACPRLAGGRWTGRGRRGTPPLPLLLVLPLPPPQEQLWPSA